MFWIWSAVRPVTLSRRSSALIRTWPMTPSTWSICSRTDGRPLAGRFLAMNQDILARSPETTWVSSPICAESWAS